MLGSETRKERDTAVTELGSSVALAGHLYPTRHSGRAAIPALWSGRLDKHARGRGSELQLGSRWWAGLGQWAAVQWLSG